jgi:hypothetical protein
MDYQFALFHYAQNRTAADGSTSIGSTISFTPITALFLLVWKPFQSFLGAPFGTIWLLAGDLVRFLFSSYPGVRYASIGLITFYLWKLSVWVRKDLEAFYALGRGGTPSNIYGWWKLKRLMFFGKIPDVLVAPYPDPHLEPYRGILSHLPQRAGVRPRVEGCAPQRQVTDKQPQKNFDKVLNILKKLAAKYPDLIYVKKSFLEGLTLGLHARETEKTVGEGVSVLKAQFGFEIAHPHRIDGSLHMNMHPEDISMVIRAGWGERHPISNTYWYWLLYFNVIKKSFDFLREKPSRPPIPETLVFIYAPRDNHERNVIRKLVLAASWWVTGENFPELEAEREELVEGKCGSEA